MNDIMDLNTIHKKPFALAVITKSEEGKEELEVFPGTAEWDGSQVHFHPSSGDPAFLLPEDYYNQIEKVKDEFRSIMKEAEYMLTLRMEVKQENSDEEKNEIS